MRLLPAFACAALAGLVASNARADHYTFTNYFTSGDIVTGSFDGTGSGNLITNLSNISVSFDGYAFHNNGSLLGVSYDAGSNAWHLGGAVASLDGSQNDFGFVDANFLITSNFTNYFENWSQGGVMHAYAYAINYGYQVASDDTGGRVWTITDTSAVPEPTSLMLFGAGLVALGATRRQKRSR